MGRLRWYALVVARLVSACAGGGVVDEDDVLAPAALRALLPPISGACRAHRAETAPEDGRARHTFTYDGPTSEWDRPFVRFEADLFEAELSHENARDASRSWALRVGSGANMYSFRGAYGEVIPPQIHPKAPWIDEVCQSVSVNREKKQNSGKLFFVHQAGAYMKDPPHTSRKPFFSPSVAKHCEGPSCSFAAWGQQAHVPTYHESHVLYANSYTDCGDGVVELASVVHNAADVDGGGDVLTFFNVPWTGVRSSVLRDVLRANENGTSTRVWPLHVWPATEDIQWIDDTGGFVTFAERLLAPDDLVESTTFHMPCKTGGSAPDCADKNVLRLELVDDVFEYSQFHSEVARRYCGYLKIRKQFKVTDGCRDCDLWFTNERTGERMHVLLVVHWAFESEQTYVCPEDGLEAANITEMFRAGDEIRVSYANEGRPAEDNLALAHVYGHQSPSVKHWAPYQVQVGLTGQLIRDAKIYTVKPRVTLRPGDTYVYRQYLLTGALVGMDERASAWVKEAYEEQKTVEDFEDDYVKTNNRTVVDVRLWSTDGVVFGATVGDEPCGGVSADAAPRCVGRSGPGLGRTAHFAVTCGDRRSYVGPDQYAFASRGPGPRGIVRPYVCDVDGADADLRPTWRLLGFFRPTDCDGISEARYDAALCRRTASTAAPSSPPSSPPSSEATKWCALDYECSDHVFCNGRERCVFGVCRPGEPPVCDDGDPSTLDVCSNERDACTVACASDADCDDGVFCNGRETCNDDGVCEAGKTPSCDDGDPCTEDECDASSDRCVNQRDIYCRCGDGVCDYPFERRTSCPGDCKGEAPRYRCGDGVCNAGDGENCVTCSQDCNGDDRGNNNNRPRRFCCGHNGTPCSDRRCRRNRRSCEDERLGFAAWTCGDGVCRRGENEMICPFDCTTDETTCCGDGVCNADENCETCPADCRRRGRLCCDSNDDRTCADRRCRSDGYACDAGAACSATRTTTRPAFATTSTTSSCCDENDDDDDEGCSCAFDELRDDFLTTTTPTVSPRDATRIAPTMFDRHRYRSRRRKEAAPPPSTDTNKQSTNDRVESNHGATS